MCPEWTPIDHGAPEGIRTPDPQIRSLVLYPAELPAPQVKAACEGDATAFAVVVATEPTERNIARAAAPHSLSPAMFVSAVIGRIVPRHPSTDS